MRRRIPSIEALVAFEAAARHLSFTRAADAIALSQSAVCKQIASLEDFLGVPLFNRIKKRISLTEAGAAYAREVTEGLDRLERSTLSVMAHRGRRNVLELAVIPTFATRWLIPRLPDFQRRHPEVTVNLTTRNRPFVFPESRFDAAIHFGTAVWPGAVMKPLFGEAMVPVCSPRLLERMPCTEPGDLAHLPLLHQAHRHDAWPRWFEAAGAPDLDVMQGPRFELFSMLVEAARAQLGVALVPRFLAAGEIASGELVVPFDLPLESTMGYYFVYPELPEVAPALGSFAEWLLGEAEAYRASVGVSVERGGVHPSPPRPSP